VPWLRVRSAVVQCNASLRACVRACVCASRGSRKRAHVRVTDLRALCSFLSISISFTHAVSGRKQHVLQLVVRLTLSHHLLACLLD
jgi:hypothetical protein